MSDDDKIFDGTIARKISVEELVVIGAAVISTVVCGNAVCSLLINFTGGDAEVNLVSFIRSGIKVVSLIPKKEQPHCKINNILIFCINQTTDI